MKGTAARFLEELHEMAHISDLNIAEMMKFRPDHVAAWRKGMARPGAIRQLLLCDIHEVVSELAKTKSPAEIYAWMYSHNADINETPVNAIRNGRILGLRNYVEGMR